MANFILHTSFGPKDVNIDVSRYPNGNLALVCYEGNGEEGPWSRLTIDFGKKLPENRAYLDLRFQPFLESDLAKFYSKEYTDEEIGDGCACFDMKFNGTNVCPLVEFDLNKLEA